jgi:hypothetical protein
MYGNAADLVYALRRWPSAGCCEEAMAVAAASACFTISGTMGLAVAYAPVEGLKLLLGVVLIGAGS